VAYKATADVVSKAVTLLVTVAAARVLAPQAFGLLALAMTTGWLLGVASDAGLPLYLARALAAGTAPAGAVVRSVMRLRAKLALAAVVAGTLVAIVWAPQTFVVAFALIVTAQVAGAVLETLSHVYRGLGRSEIESSIVIAQRLFAAGLASAVLMTRPSLLLLSVALVVPPVIALAASLAIAARLTRQLSGHRADLPFTFEGFRNDAAPIGLGILISAIYFRCDVYFLNYWHGLEAVGAYNAVFRLVEALRLFPAAVLAVVFPELCRAATLRPLRRLSAAVTAAGALAMAIIVAAAPGIVHAAYGAAYDAAAAPLQVLALAVPLFFLNYALMHQVIAWRGQRQYLAMTCAALVGNVGANLALIPSAGMLGAAWATVLTEVVVTAGCLLSLRSLAPTTAEKGSDPFSAHRANTVEKGSDPFAASLTPKPDFKAEAP
jgi:O-antigen/teichoic acid export membrane protein